MNIKVRKGGTIPFDDSKIKPGAVFRAGDNYHMRIEPVKPHGMGPGIDMLNVVDLRTGKLHAFTAHDNVSLVDHELVVDK